MNKHEGIVRRAEAIRSEIVGLRRHFHQHPELGLQEFETTKKVEGILKGLGLETRTFAKGTGVCGYLRGAKGKKTVALRADMDALPLQEGADVPYRSKFPGVMHGCGHDAHTAMLLGAAMILSDMVTDLPGNVVFLFQPAEETGMGAKEMVTEGALDGVDGIFALHVSSTHDSGTIAYRSGPIMSAGDFFDVTIHGKGGHAGIPHLAIDPVTMVAMAITAVQTVVSREIDPVESGLISICKLEAGTGAYNVIPDSASFGGTIRSLTPELRDYLPTRMKQVVEGVVSGMRGRAEFNLMPRFPLTVNDERMTAFVVGVARELLGEGKVREIKPLLGSEDFSFYLQKIPGCFVYLGTRNEAKGIVYPHHHPQFDVDEDALTTGTALNVAVATEYLRQCTDEA
jgi:amidohydrolase